MAFLVVGVALAIGQQQPPRQQQQPEEGPPKLKRGKPKAGEARGEPAAEQRPIPPPPLREIVTDADGNVVSETGPLPAAADRSANPAPDDFIARARRVAREFQSRMPNFICEQITYRHEGKGWPRPNWKLKDRVTAELMFNEGAETYRNVKVSGKLFGIGRNRPPEKTGNWSTGDWVSLSVDVVDASTNADFKFDKEDLIGGRKARRYTYTVKEPSSHWRVILTESGGEVKPAYRGAVWIDTELYRVLRVELEARELKPDYPLNVVEMTVELGVVNIAGSSYLLPVKSENLACERDSLACSRNELEFRNYRKFTVESSISTTDSSVSFEGEDKPTPGKK